MKSKLPKKQELEEKLVSLIDDPDTSDTAIVAAIKTLIEIDPDKGMERLMKIYHDGVGKNQVAVIRLIHSLIPKSDGSIDWEDIDIDTK